MAISHEAVERIDHKGRRTMVVSEFDMVEILQCRRHGELEAMVVSRIVDAIAKPIIAATIPAIERAMRELATKEANQ